MQNNTNLNDWVQRGTFGAIKETLGTNYTGKYIGQIFWFKEVRLVQIGTNGAFAKVYLCTPLSRERSMIKYKLNKIVRKCTS